MNGGEVKEFICNTCRFERKRTSDWTLEGPTKIAGKSVISANKYGASTIFPAFSLTQAAKEYKQIDDSRDTSFLVPQKQLN